MQVKSSHFSGPSPLQEHLCESTQAIHAALEAFLSKLQADQQQQRNSFRLCLAGLWFLQIPMADAGYHSESLPLSRLWEPQRKPEGNPTKSKPLKLKVVQSSAEGTHSPGSTRPAPVSTLQLKQQDFMQVWELL